MNNFENLYLTKDLSILGFRPSFAAKLADFERIIDNDFMQLVDE